MLGLLYSVGFLVRCTFQKDLNKQTQAKIQMQRKKKDEYIYKYKTTSTLPFAIEYRWFILNLCVSHWAHKVTATYWKCRKFNAMIFKLWSNSFTRNNKRNRKTYRFNLLNDQKEWGDKFFFFYIFVNSLFVCIELVEVRMKWLRQRL